MVLAAAALSFPRVEPSRTEQLAAALGLKALQLDHLRRGAASTVPAALAAAHCQLEQRLQARSLLAAQQKAVTRDFAQRQRPSDPGRGRLTD